MRATEDEIADVAVDAARRAGKILKSYADRHLRVNQTTRHELKLEVDRVCEEAILEAITATFPEHSVLSRQAVGPPIIHRPSTLSLPT